MGRKKHTRMKIVDLKVSDGRCIISIEIRRGQNVWNKAYGFNSDQLREGEFEAFNDALKSRVLADALKLEDDRNFEERVLMRIESMVGQQIVLD